MKKFYTLIALTFSSLFVSIDLMGVNISNSSSTACRDTLYDNGGPGGNTTNNQLLTYTISPTGASRVRIRTFSFTLGTGDTVFIYDGANATFPVLAALRQGSANPDSVTSTGSSITVRLKTNSSNNLAGFNFRWEGIYIPNVSITSSPLTVCTGTTVNFSVSDSSHGGFNPIFTWKLNGTTVGSDNFKYSTIPVTGDSVWVVMTRAGGAACGITDGVNTDSSSIIEITNTNYDTADVALSADDTTICLGTTVNFTATPTNGGGSPVYSWTINGSPVGTNSPNFSTAALANLDEVVVTMASDFGTGCLIDSIISDTLIMFVNATIASVSLAASDNSVCIGTAVNFTASPTNGGATPIYSWEVNGSPVGIDSAGYSSSSLADGDEVIVTMTSSLVATCLVDSISSDTVIITIFDFDTASVSVSASDTTICPGTNVTFTATPTNGGGSPVYSWTSNGSAVGTNSPNYSNAALANGDEIKVTMASSISTGCLVDSISVDSITIAVQANTTASVSLAATDTTICAGVNVTFTATPTNGGGTPVYSWTRNGTPVGTNSPNYSNAALANGDEIKVTMASSFAGGCLVDSISIDSITIAVQSLTTASVSLSATDETICAGTNVTFTATPTNGGGSPVYSWTRNGSAVGTNSPNYSNAALTNNDEVQVTMTSSFSGGCLVDSISTDSIIMAVQANTTASVDLAASDLTICAGTNVNFTATPTNGGGTPVYSWTRNGSSVGTNSPNYSNASLTNGDEIKVFMASSFNGGCLIDSISEDSVTVAVQANTTASVNVTVSDPSVCAGTNVSFTATPTNGGGSPVYSWTRNGSAVGTNSPNYSNAALADNDEIQVNVASSFSGGCLIDSISSDSIIMNINPNPTVIVTTSTDVDCYGNSNGSATALAAGGTGTKDYQWDDPSNQITATATGLDQDFYTVVVTDDSLCVGSDTITISEPAQLDLTFVISHVSTFGGNDGSIQATGTGGSPYIGPGQDGYFHNWKSGQGTGHGGTKAFTHTISGLFANWYVDTLTDNNGCIFIDSALVTQPTQLTGGEIRINGTTIAKICNDDTVGLMAQAQASTGGVGTKTYTWQRSSNGLNWSNIPSSNSTDYTFNDTILTNIFIRRRVVDLLNDSNHSNFLFLNYVPDVLINIIGLNPQYCDIDADEAIFGSPNAPGIGWFTNSAYMDSASATFSPSAATSNPGGVSNSIFYNYVDPNGCYSNNNTSTIVYQQDTGHIWMDKYIFTLDEDADTIYNSYPAGSFIGTGVYFSAGIWYFDPGLVDSSFLDSTVNLYFQYTNPAGCVTLDTIVINIVASQFVLTTNLSDVNEFSGCYFDSILTVYAKPGLGDTITNYYFYYYDEFYSNYYYDANFYTTFTTSPIVHSFNPKLMTPCCFNTTTTPTPTGVSRYHYYFIYYTTSNPGGFVYTKDLEVVHLDKVRIVPDQLNSDGSSSTPLQYCVNVADIDMSPNVYPLPAPRNTTLNYSITPTIGGQFNQLDTNGNGKFFPGNSGTGNRNLTLTYTDDRSGCSKDTTYQIKVDPLPNVSILGLPDTNCANDGIVAFHGTPYAINKGNFTSPTSFSLGLTHINGDSVATINAQPSNVGNHYVKYTYQHTTGCINKDSTSFTVFAQPVMSMTLGVTGSFSSPSICVSDNTPLVITGTVNGVPAVVGDSIVGPGITYPFSGQNGQATFTPSVAGAGVKTIRYYYTDNIGCSKFIESNITVNALPNASFITSTNDYNTCNVLGENLNFTYTGGASGTSEYSIDGSPVTIFAPVVNSNIGFGANEVVHKFTQSVTTCVNYDTITVTVDPFPVVSISGITPTYCYNDAAITFTGSPASPGSGGGNTPSYFHSPLSSFNFTDVQALLGENSGSFVANSSHIGMHKISYNYTNPSTGCSSGDTFDLEILDIPQLAIRRKSAPLSPLIHCKGDTVHYQKLINGLPDVSAFSYLIGPGFADSTSNVFDPDLAGVSSGPNHHTVTYKTTDPNGCYNETDSMIVVLETSDASFGVSASTACVDPVEVITITPSFIGGASSKFYYHGKQKTGASTMFFYMDSAFVGTDSIIYIFDDGTGCSDTSTQYITVNDTPSVSFSGVVDDYCVNQGQFVAHVNQPSIGNSYFRSYHNIGAVRSYNNMLDSGSVGSGIDSIQFVPLVTKGSDTLMDEIVFLEYVHTDANGCEGIGWVDLYINNLPVLSVNTNNADNAICANQEQITLQGVADGLPNQLGGFFTASLIGTSNAYVNNTTNSNGTYGTVPVDSFFTDTVYYHFTDLTGCFNTKAKTIAIKKLPPPYFSVNALLNHSTTKSICPDELGTTVSFYDNCDTCKTTLWPTAANKLVRRWYVNDSALTAIAAGKFTPGSGPAFDQTFYNSYNIITQQMWDNRWLPSCYVEYTDSVYLDTFPIVDVIMDPLYCSNGGNVTFKGSPASPFGINPAAQASVFSSPNMHGGFTTPLPTLGLDSIILNMNTLVPGPTAGFLPYHLKYEYSHPITSCKSSKQETFNLMTRPNLEITSTKKTFCPYDLVQPITLRVNGNAILTNVGSTLTGQGVGSISPVGAVNYIPSSFLGDTFIVKDYLTFDHTDINGCSHTIVDSMDVLAQPILNLIIDTTLFRADSACFDAPPVNLTIQYLDRSTLTWTTYGPLSGPSAPGDDNFFNFESNTGVFSQPYLGPASIVFVPRWDSKGDVDGTVTQIRFIGTYEQGGTCSDTIIRSIVTHPKPVADFRLDGLCEKYAPVMHGDSSYHDLANFSPTDGIMSYIWQVDDSIATEVNGGIGDTLVDYTYKYALPEGNHEITLIVKSKKDCFSNDTLKEFTFVKSPDADFNWNMDEECLGSSVTFRSISELNGTNVTYNWDFGDGSPNLTDTFVSHSYDTAQMYSVRLALQAGVDCQDTMIKDIYIRSVTDFADSSYYFDDFETPYSGWTVWKEKYDAALDNDTTDDQEPVWFERGERTVGNVKTEPGDNGWYLDYDIDSDAASSTFGTPVYHNLMQTSVISPCFTFDSSSIDRPMLTINTIYDLETNDGAVVQYTTDRNLPLEQVKWKNVGDYLVKNNVHYNTGINWYTKENIFGSPGNQTDNQHKMGWTNPDNSSPFTASWKESRHDLDTLMNQTNDYVRFRVAFGSSADAKGEGFIFDDFGIRNRKKYVVFETFTTGTENGYKSIMENYDNKIAQSKDKLDIQYHTSFPKSDPMNQDNTSDPSARALFYGVSEVPYLQGDGINYSDFHASQTTDIFTLKPEALEDPKFVVNMVFNPATNVVTTEIISVSPEFLTNPPDVTVQVALVEKVVDGSQFGSSVAANFGSYAFKNVLKRLYPNAAGTSFDNMFPGETKTITTTLLYENFYGDESSEFKVIAFVQDKATKEIYQANWVDENRTTTVGIKKYEEFVAGGVDYILYPNPTSGQTNMTFESELLKSYQLTVFNQVGVMVLQDVVAEGSIQHSFDISKLTPGMYFVMLNDGTQKVAIKKLLLTR